MNRKLNCLLTFILALVLVLANSGDAYAGKGGGGGGGSRGYSSGGGGISRSVGGGSVSRSVSVKPASSGGGGGIKSYSSSNNTTTNNASKGYSSSVKPNTSGGNNTGNKSPPAGYSSNSNSYSKKPAANFQSLPAAEQKKAESRAAYQKATAPKDTYVTPKGETKKIDVNDPQTKKVQDTYAKNPEKWVNRKSRVDDAYHDYYNRPQPTIVYRDHHDFNPWFWMWLSDRALDDRAAWYYHHRGDIDEQRYKDALAKDAQLEARIRDLEAKKTPRDPGYSPPGLDPDLQYDDGFCDGVFNPQPAPHNSTPISWGGFWHGLWVVVKWVFGIILVLILLGVLYWLVFEFRW